VAVNDLGVPVFAAKIEYLRKLMTRSGVSVGFLLVPAALTMALKSHPAFNPLISLSFLVAVSAAAWWGGAGAGILASCATIPVLTLAATGGKSFLPPHIDLLGIAIFCFISVLVSRVATNRKRIEQLLRSANEQLENRVFERTSELRQAHAELVSREEQFRTLANAIPHLCWMADGSGSAVWCNDRWTAYTGITLDQLQNSGWTAAHAEEVLPGVMKRWQASLAAGEPFEMEFPLRDCGGGFRWFLTRVLPVRDSDGRAVRWLGTATDIDELRRSREALLESEARFRAMADAAPVMIWVSAVDKTFTWFNKPWLDFTGFTIDQELRAQWSEGIHPDDRGRCLEMYAHNFDMRTEYIAEYRCRHRDGRWRWVLNRGVPRYGASGDFLGYIGSCIDIHERKEMEEDLRRANGDLQQFAYSASHDLQEPIRTAAIYSQLLEKVYGSKLNGKAQTFLGYIIAAARRMEKLVDDLLLYTQASDLEAAPLEAISANKALQQALENLSITVNEAGAQITSDPLPMVNISNVHLLQLFQNLVGNSIKYRENGPVRIHVSARQENAYWLFSVQDNGIGIDPAYKERIFGIFKRLHTNDRYSGTGIGLAICLRIVERYHGRIWVESELGKGATFIFAIPV
jgi:PAS domain S-box-containing protein